MIPANPKTMAIIGPIVNNNALFMVGILLIPFLMLVIPSSKPRSDHTSASRADQRLVISETRKQTRWRMAAAVLSVFIALFIAFDFVYGQNRKLSPPKAVAAVNGLIRIPLHDVNDGVLHRYVVKGTSVRFIVLKLEGNAIATAFDACEICGSQGYTQEGGAVVCLNCSADINSASLGRAGGCNPVPLHSRLEGDSLLIQESSLLKEQKRFKE
jgi:uncharacterized membrane protein